ncbi:MAG: hypothetical protein GF393_03900 [Armatimonadia bacterium]|nr:hypothetical protein [Armatimonadia bacterium]
MMADAKMDNENAVENEQELPTRNRRIIEWIHEQRADSPTDEDKAWAKRFRRFVSEHPLEFSRDASE